MLVKEMYYCRSICVLPQTHCKIKLEKCITKIIILIIEMMVPTVRYTFCSSKYFIPKYQNQIFHFPHLKKKKIRLPIIIFTH